MKPSVLFLVENLPVPQDGRVWMEARTLQRSGFDVSVISPRNPQQKKFEKLSEIHIYRYLRPAKSSGYASYVREYLYSFLATLYLAIKIYAKRRFTVIHAANPPDFFCIIALFFKPLGVKFIYDQHDLAPEMFISRFKKDENHVLYKALRLLERLSHSLCDVYITTCASGREKVRKRISICSANYIVRSAPDLKKICRKQVNAHAAAQIRKRFQYVCSYLGVMGPQDGVDKLLRSIAIISRERKMKNVGFVLMGDGDDHERLIGMAKELGITSQVIFTGWADARKISTYLYSSDLGLMPEPKDEYTDNSLHNKVMEYMAAGLPVVSYDLKEARESAGAAAVYVPGNDERLYADAIVNLLENKTLRYEMGEAGAKRVRKLFRKEYSEQELKRAYGELFPDLFPVDLRTL